MRTRTVAVMFTDIKGFTALTSSQSYDQNALLLRTHARLVRPVIQAFGGTLVKTIGDSFMAVFPSPTKAVHCAMAIEDRLWLHNEGVEESHKIHLRIAVNVGEMRVERNDYFGEAVNIAARMEGVTPAGEIYISDALYFTMNRQDVATEKVGSFEFKGIPDPITVYRIPPYVDPSQQELRFTAADDDSEAETADTQETHLTEAETVGPPYGARFLRGLRRKRLQRLAWWIVPVLLLGFVLSALLGSKQGRDRREAQLTEIESLLNRNDLETAAQRVELFSPTSKSERTRRDAARRRLAWSYYRSEQPEKAQQELDWLLTGATREARDLLLRGHLHFALAGASAEEAVSAKRKGLEAYEEALSIDLRVGNDQDLAANIVGCYHVKPLRSKADWLVQGYVKGRAAQAMVRELEDPELPFALRHWFVSRLTKLEAEDLVDWVAVSLRDLEDGTCKYRKAAIVKLEELGDPRAIGPLIKLAGERRCGSREAKKVSEVLLAQTGGRR